ncbi:MAG: NAD(P)-dependent oxidoreductase [Candidatus Omnitrophica bacterium]|nr:NAD(P)-dependent oxidoreductase [Candidatus Omnitrophota bacterium]
MNMKILVTGGSGFIGTNYTEFLFKNKVEFINLDAQPPRNPMLNEFWRKCDILDYPRLEKLIKDFAPTHVVHLAAKTGLSETKLSQFSANIEGVQGLLKILKETPSVKRAIFTSSLLVCQMGYVPKSDIEYKPTTLYGQSKVEGEKIIRRAQDIAFDWIIIRPISVWGPWQEEPYINFFKSVANNWYFHIGCGHYKRSMGYVENMAYQIHQLLSAPAEKVNRRTFYLGDNLPVDLYVLASEIQEITKAKKIHRLPLWIVETAAKTGDILKRCGWHNFPLTSFRLNNIRTEYVFDLSPITGITGPLPYDFKTAVQRTVQWMKKTGEI